MLIATQDELDRLIDALRTRERFALDTEFISEQSFRPRLCLAQVAYEDDSGETVVVAVDPFGTGGAALDITSLTELIIDPSIEKVVHAGQQDMMIFFDLAGRLPGAIFDTQIAAALVGIGDGIGYTRLVEACLGVHLEKGEAYTDWSRRPLAKRQVEYALDDVRHLLPIHGMLVEQLRTRGREEWLREELAVYADPAYFRHDPETMFRRLRGTQRLGRRELAVLKELAKWREEEAAERDCPRGRIATNELLVELARRSPTSQRDLETMRGVHPRLLKRYAGEILTRIGRAQSRPEKSWPERAEAPAKDSELTPLVDLLEIVLKDRAREARVGAAKIATRRQLHELVCAVRDGRENELDLPMLSGWRGDLIGHDIFEVLEGRAAIAVDHERLEVIIESRSGGAPRPQ